MTKFKSHNETYPSYKDSKVDWLGEIPADWELLPALRFIEESRERNVGMIENQVLSLSYGNIVTKSEEQLTGLVPESFETYQVVNEGDIIVRGTDLQNDKKSLRTALSKNRGIITSAYLNLRHKPGVSPRYLHYYFHSMDTTKSLYKYGSGLRQNLSFDDFKRMPIPDIDEEHQVAIANFLDDKSKKIEQAIAIKERQIEHLKERKQILIQNAVTRGLNPDAPMKDSGVDWIGEIPSHWELKKVKQATTMISKGTTPSTIGRDTVELGPVRYLKAENISEGIVTEKPLFFIDEETDKLLSRSSLIADDVLFVIAGATLGKTAIVTELVSPANTNQAVAFLRSNKSVYSAHLQLWLSTDIIKQLIWLNAVQSAQPNLSMENLGNFPIILPPLEEQIELRRFLKKETTKIDAAIKIQITQIKKLKEYKASLINSAVTGKIKVTA